MHPITFGDLWFGDHVAPHGPAHLTDSSTHQERAKTSFRSESRLNLKGFQCSQGMFLNPFGRKPGFPLGNRHPGIHKSAQGFVTTRSGTL
jgi:hypothetical protein